MKPITNPASKPSIAAPAATRAINRTVVGESEIVGCGELLHGLHDVATGVSVAVAVGSGAGQVGQIDCGGQVLAVVHDVATGVSVAVAVGSGAGQVGQIDCGGQVGSGVGGGKGQ